MRVYLILALAVIVLLSCAVWALAFMEQSVEAVSQGLPQLQAAIQSENWTSADTLLQQTKKTCYGYTDKWSLLIHHQDIKSPLESLRRLEFFIVSRQKTAAEEALILFEHKIKTVVEGEKPRLNNIF